MKNKTSYLLNGIFYSFIVNVIVLNIALNSSYCSRASRKNEQVQILMVQMKFGL